MISIRLSLKRAFYDLLVGGDVEEEVLVLRRRVLGAVGAGVAHDHHDGLLGLLGLGLAEELEARVGDEVGEVVLGVVVVVPDLRMPGIFRDLLRVLIFEILDGTFFPLTLTV